MIADLDGCITGLKESTRAVKAGRAKMAYVAENADAHIRLPFVDICREKNVPVTFIPTCRELGIACGIDVGAAVAVVPSDTE